MKKIITLAFVAAISACSVNKAVKQTGITVSEVKNCNTKVCLLSTGLELVSHKEQGPKTIEIYRGKASQNGLNYARAVVHGVLDVGTLGLWEVAGTPIESIIENNQTNLVVKAEYNKKTPEIISKLEIYKGSSNLVHAK
jgi:hypothetical protein